MHSKCPHPCPCPEQPSARTTASKATYTVQKPHCESGKHTCSEFTEVAVAIVAALPWGLQPMQVAVEAERWTVADTPEALGCALPFLGPAPLLLALALAAEGAMAASAPGKPPASALASATWAAPCPSTAVADLAALLGSSLAAAGEANGCESAAAGSSTLAAAGAAEEPLPKNGWEPPSPKMPAAHMDWVSTTRVHAGGCGLCAYALRMQEGARSARVLT